MQPTPAPAEPGSVAPRLFTLGIHAGAHDPAAALVLDGQVLAAAEEERFTRTRRGQWPLPFHAIDFCLKEAGATLADVSHVACSPDPLSAAQGLDAPRQLREGAPPHLGKRLALPDPAHPPYRWHDVAHPLCQQASAFLAAPFSRCAVLTLNGHGEQACTSYGRYRDSRYEALGEVRAPHSLGLMYEHVTRHLGFLPCRGEHQVMALAALGMPTHADRLRDHLVVHGDGQYRWEPLDFDAAFGPARTPGAALTPQHHDLAASLQRVLEETALQLAAWLRERSGEQDLALAGGLALNCLMNSRLRDAGIFQRVWVQPAADAGVALGAALWVDARERRGLEDDGAHIRSAEASDAQSGAVFTLAPRRWQMAHAYLGPSYEDDEVEALLQWARLRYRRVEEVARQTAQLLAQDLLVGWFQGAMEFGPRALGARSILASPANPTVQARINALKDREDFLPLSPAVNVEQLADWFEPAGASGGESPFMSFIHRVKAGCADRIPAALHRDHTACVQTVHRDSNPLFHELLQAVGRATGAPVLVNTAFSVRGEPMVATPQAAIEAFFSSSLDALVIGSFILEK